MKKKLNFLILIIFVFVGWVSSCNTKTATEKPELFEVSELAGYMKQMVLDQEEVKKQILNGTWNNTIPDTYTKLDSAVPTKSSTKSPLFYAMSHSYFSAMQQLVLSDSIAYIKNFNKGIDACINCHNEFCQLPIVRIKKLYIKTNK